MIKTLINKLHANQREVHNFNKKSNTKKSRSEKKKGGREAIKIEILNKKIS